uniref:Transcription factor ERF9 n=1 Tax=Nothapodytes nimmoniana TaxID=159386 RepID=A0A9E9C630_NOTNI|nr:transcription factor ERF9 [Nothapodytes nimmoniana]
MEKPVSDNPADRRDSKYKGVRKRKWGKWVSEIRLPNSRERIWLGSYDKPEKAARAFDAALFCLRGRTAKFNFPDNPPDIVVGRSLTPAQIQIAAARFANSDPLINDPVRSGNFSSSSTSSELRVESPSSSQSLSNGLTHLDSEMTSEIDTSVFDICSMLGSQNNSMSDNGIFPGFDDFFLQPLPNVDYEEENCDVFCSQDASLWNF